MALAWTFWAKGMGSESGSKQSKGPVDLSSGPVMLIVSGFGLWSIVFDRDWRQDLCYILLVQSLPAILLAALVFPTRPIDHLSAREHREAPRERLDGLLDPPIHYLPLAPASKA